MKKIGLVLAAAAATLFVAGCATQGTDSGNNASASAQPAAVAQPAAGCKGKSACKSAKAKASCGGKCEGGNK